MSQQIAGFQYFQEKFAIAFIHLFRLKTLSNNLSRTFCFKAFIRQKVFKNLQGELKTYFKLLYQPCPLKLAVIMPVTSTGQCGNGFDKIVKPLLPAFLVVTAHLACAVLAPISVSWIKGC